jgi:hypothetical protein
MSINVCSKCGKRNRYDASNWSSGTTPVCRNCGKRLSLPNSVAVDSTASAFEAKPLKSKMLNFTQKPGRETRSGRKNVVLFGFAGLTTFLIYWLGTPNTQQTWNGYGSITGAPGFRNDGTSGATLREDCLRNVRWTVTKTLKADTELKEQQEKWRLNPPKQPQIFLPDNFWGPDNSIRQPYGCVYSANDKYKTFFMNMLLGGPAAKYFCENLNPTSTENGARYFSWIVPLEPPLTSCVKIPFK